jgi:large subunit ribosomal protein L6
VQRSRATSSTLPSASRTRCSYKLPAGVKAEVDKEGKLSVKSADKSLLGKVAADIRGFRPPEPYKGKGVRYQGEAITLKEGKARGKK